MKNLLITSLIGLFLVSCSPSSEQSKSSTDVLIKDSFENLIEFNEINGELLSGQDMVLKNTSGGLIETTLISLDIEEGEKGVQRFKLINKERRASVSVSVTEGQSTPAGLTLNNSCPTTLNRRQSCYVSFEIDATSLSEGSSLNHIVNINGTDYTVSYTILASSKPTLEEEAESLLTVSSSEGNSIDFGTLKINYNEKNQKTISIRNFSRKNLPINIDGSSLSNISYTTSCGSDLDRGRGCLIFLKLDSSGKTESTVSENLIVSGNTFSLSGILDELDVAELQAEEEAKAQASLAYSFTSHDFGGVEEGSSKLIQLHLINESREEIPLNIDDGSLSDFSIGSCPASLSRNQSCYLSISFDTNGKSLGAKSESFSISGQLISINGEVLEKIIPSDNSLDDPELASLPQEGQTYVMNLSSNSEMSFSNSDRRLDKEFPFDFQNPPTGLIITDTCNGVIKRSSSCSITFDYSGALNLLHTILVNGKEYRLEKAGVGTQACSLNEASDNGWDLTEALTAEGNIVDGDISACIISTCTQGYVTEEATKKCVVDGTDFYMTGQITSGDSYGVEIYKFNRLTDQMELFYDENGTSDSSYVGSFMIASNGKYYFTQSYASTGSELVEYDPILDQKNIIDINPGISGSFPSIYAELNGYLIMKARVNNGTETYTYNMSTGVVTEFDIHTSGFGNPSFYFINNGKAYLKSNTTSGNKLIELDPVSGSYNTYDYLNYPVLVGNYIYGAAYDASTGTELYKLNLSNGVKSLVKDVRAGTSSSNISQLTLIGSSLYFEIFSIQFLFFILFDIGPLQPLLRS